MVVFIDCPRSFAQSSVSLNSHRLNFYLERSSLTSLGRSSKLACFLQKTRLFVQKFRNASKLNLFGANVQL